MSPRFENVATVVTVPVGTRIRWIVLPFTYVMKRTPPTTSATPQYAQLSQVVRVGFAVAPRSVTTPAGTEISYTRLPLCTRMRP